MTLESVSPAPSIHIGQALFRYRWKVLGFLIVSMGLIIAGLYLFPPTYQSEAKLFVRIGRESVALDPTATTGQTIPVHESRENEINSIAEVLKSRALAEKVVQELGADVVLGRVNADGTSVSGGSFFNSVSDSLGQVLEWIDPLKPVSDREKAIIRLTKKLRIRVEEKSNVISLTFKAKSPNSAQIVLATLVETYLDEHVRLNRTAGSFDFFVEQAKQYEDQLVRASEELRNLKNTTGLLTVEGERNQLQVQIGAIELKQINIENALAASEAKVAALRGSVKSLPERIKGEEVSGLPNNAGDDMRNLLYELEIRERQILSTVTPNHPRAIAIRRQVEEVRSIFDSQVTERSQSTTIMTPTRQALHLQLLTEEAVAASLRSQVQTLTGQHDAAMERLKKLNFDAVLLENLQRRKDLLEAEHRAYAENREQARIGQALELERISNVNVAQSASLTEKPVSPKRLLVLFLGAFASLAGAVAMALLLDRLNKSLRTPEEVESHLNLPVLISLPQVSSRHMTMH